MAISLDLRGEIATSQHQLTAVKRVLISSLIELSLEGSKMMEVVGGIENRQLHLGRGPAESLILFGIEALDDMVDVSSLGVDWGLHFCFTRENSFR
jgi:hypothetical protein